MDKTISDISQLEKLYDIVYKYSQKLKKMNNYANGQKMWQAIKPLLEQFDSSKYPKWNTIILPNGEYYNLIGDKVLSLTEYSINGKGKKKLVEHNHFIIQLFRIPQKEKPTLKKIIQLAFNAGQLSVFLKSKTFEPIDEYDIINKNNIVETYTKYEIYKLNNFIEKKCQNIVHIPDDVIKKIKFILKAYVSSIDKSI